MKSKNVQRSINAYNRLKDQISSKRYSSEFKARVANLKQPEKEVAQTKYWEAKNKELVSLEVKLRGYI